VLVDARAVVRRLAARAAVAGVLVGELAPAEGAAVVLRGARGDGEAREPRAAGLLLARLARRDELAPERREPRREEDARPEGRAPRGALGGVLARPHEGRSEDEARRRLAAREREPEARLVT